MLLIMVPQWIIEKKRDGGVLHADEIRFFINGYTEGVIPDYQMAALAMAIYFQGMTPDETAALTDAMMRSGDTLSFADWPLPTADKHSTGGIGDKVSLILGPLAASAGLAVPMISGRGLGLTGGTLDKLESVPGFNTRLTVDAFRTALTRAGCAIIGQTDRLAPADRKLYALRDVTGTVPSIPLITASIMSKKLAEGAASLVFDVKCGRGAFMRTREQARALAESLLRVGRALGRNMAALITDMEQPLGRAVGNALEVREAVEILRGSGPGDVRQLTLSLTARMCLLAGLADDQAAAERDLATRLDDGRALAAFRDLVAAQGGDIRVAEDPDAVLPRATAVREVAAPADGWVIFVDAEAVGRVALQLGAGRRRSDDAIDPAAGADRLVQCGERICRGQPLMRLHAATPALIDAVHEAACRAVTLADTPVTRPPLILEEK